MSDIAYIGGNSYLYLKAEGVDQVYFKKLVAPPFAILDRGILYELTDGKLYYNGNEIITSLTPIGTGDVVGPASATDNAIARYNSTTGKLIQNSLVTIDDLGNIQGTPSVSLTQSEDSPFPLDPGTIWLDTGNVLRLNKWGISGTATPSYGLMFFENASPATVSVTEPAFSLVDPTTTITSNSSLYTSGGDGLIVYNGETSQAQVTYTLVYGSSTLTSTQIGIALFVNDVAVVPSLTLNVVPTATTITTSYTTQTSLTTDDIISVKATDFSGAATIGVYSFAVSIATLVV